jgi:RimJ/RimL family protein N-acetyltransferase
MQEIDAGPVRLRAFHDGDVDDIVEACNDPLSRRFLPLLPQPYRRHDALAFMHEYVPSAIAAGRAQYAIADPDSGRLLGTIGLAYRRGTVAEVGYWVAPWARGRGVATAATRALSERAFADGIARLELRTEPENTYSQRVALAAGYSWESLQRAAGEGPGGARRDLIQWVRLRGDPPGPTRRALPDLPAGELTDGVVTLRPVAADDANDLYALRSLPEVVRVTVPAQPPDRETLARNCAWAPSFWLAGSRVHLTIRDAWSDAFAGEIGFGITEAVSALAMAGYNLARDWRGRGYASRALRLLAAWAFAAVGLARLEAGTAVDNLASQRVLAAVGFQREGLQRGRLPGPGGTRVDNLLYALLPGDLRHGHGLSPTRTPPR